MVSGTTDILMKTASHILETSSVGLFERRCKHNNFATNAQPLILLIWLAYVTNNGLQKFQIFESFDAAEILWFENSNEPDCSVLANVKILLNCESCLWDDKKLMAYVGQYYIGGVIRTRSWSAHDGVVRVEMHILCENHRLMNSIPFIIWSACHIFYDATELKMTGDSALCISENIWKHIYMLAVAQKLVK